MNKESQTMTNKSPFFISDTHFGHENIVKYQERPFDSADEMDEVLIENWNNVVGPNDHVYHIGDVGLCSKERLNKILEVLNGKIFLVEGNHEYTAKKISYQFEWIKKQYSLNLDRYAHIQESNIEIVMSHYPIERWNKCHYGTIHVHGHVHSGNKLTAKNRIDVGVDGWNYTPVSIQNLIGCLDGKIFPIEAKEPPTLKIDYQNMKIQNE